jgi:uncharacterized protein (DUF2235 family)
MKRIVICCDGTWNKADQANDQGKPIPTNVVRIAYRVANSDAKGTPQIIFYDQGVGTGNLLDRVWGGATGEGLEENIFEAYRFLVANYEKDDEIYLFGFSRGAFTARSIAGLIRNSGILKRTHILSYPKALELYLHRDQNPDDTVSRKFREEHAVLPDTPIKFIGVFDTVGARGIPTKHITLTKHAQSKYEFHDAELSGSVEHAYHALALDEHRSQFEPTLWTNAPKPLRHDPAKTQKIEQVWFCGAHSDIGGGYVPWDRKIKSLSDVPLKWMIAKAQGAGLAFDQPVMANFPLQDDFGAELHKSHSIKWGLPFTRSVGKTPTEYLHHTTLDRWEQGKPEYRPKALSGLGKMAEWLRIKPRPDFTKVP